MWLLCDNCIIIKYLLDTKHDSLFHGTDIPHDQLNIYPKVAGFSIKPFLWDILRIENYRNCAEYHEV